MFFPIFFLFQYCPSASTACIQCILWILGVHLPVTSPQVKGVKYGYFLHKILYLHLFVSIIWQVLPKESCVVKSWRQNLINGFINPTFLGYWNSLSFVANRYVFCGNNLMLYHHSTSQCISTYNWWVIAPSSAKYTSHLMCLSIWISEDWVALYTVGAGTGHQDQGYTL